MEKRFLKKNALYKCLAMSTMVAVTLAGVLLALGYESFKRGDDASLVRYWQFLRPFGVGKLALSEGIAWRQGGDGHSQDFQVARRWFLVAANLESQMAYIQLAEMIDYGQGGALGGDDELKKLLLLCSGNKEIMPLHCLTRLALMDGDIVEKFKYINLMNRIEPHAGDQLDKLISADVGINEIQSIKNEAQMRAEVFDRQNWNP